MSRDESPRVINEVARSRLAGSAQTIVTCEAPRRRTIILWGKPVRLYFPYVVGVAVTSLSGKSFIDRSQSMSVLGSLAPLAVGVQSRTAEDHPVFVMPLPHTRHSTGALCLMSSAVLNVSSPIENVWQSDFKYEENVREMGRWMAATPGQVMSPAWWAGILDENTYSRYAAFGRVFPLRLALQPPASE